MLNTDAKGGSEPRTFDRDPSTRMLRKPNTNYSLHRHGLGRILILNSEPLLSDRVQRVAWYRTLCRWWLAPAQTAGSYDGLTRYQTIETGNTHSQLDRLWAAGPWNQLKPIPLVLFAGLALGFMLLIGPFDYRLLGRLKRRRWTWLLFPSLTLCFAYDIQLFVERNYDQPPQLTQRVIDLDSAGAPVRESIFQLSLLPQETQTVDEMRETIRSRVSASNHHVEYQGSFPAAYQMRERRLRWSSSIHRTFRIAELNETAPHAEISQLDWIKLTPTTHAWTAERQEEIRKIVEQKLPQAEVSFLDADSETEASVTMSRSSPKTSKGDLYRRLISPTGGPDLHDLLLHDRQLAEQRTLVIEFTRATETVVYRSNYH